MFNIKNFRQEILNNGVVKSNRYLVTFAPPTSLKSEKTDYLTLRCTSAQIPGMTFATIDGPPRIGYGPIESNPYGVIFDDVVLTFLLDAKAGAHKFFYKWSSSIVNYDSKGQTALKELTNGKHAFEVGYKDDYSTDITITVYNGIEGSSSDANETPIMTYKLYRAFPKVLPQFDMSWDNSNDLIKLPVSFAYTDFTVTY